MLSTVPPEGLDGEHRLALLSHSDSPSRNVPGKEQFKLGEGKAGLHSNTDRGARLAWTPSPECGRIVETHECGQRGRQAKGGPPGAAGLTIFRLFVSYNRG